MNRPHIRSRADALAWLTGARSWNTGRVTQRTVCNNTVCRVLDDQQTLAIRLHDTDVVVYKPDGSTSLYTGGWKTVTTKQRINAHCPPGWGVYSNRGAWYLEGRGLRFPYADGITITATGQVLHAAAEPDRAALNAELRRIKEYAAGFLRELFAGKIAPPGIGDCWYCLMREGSEQPAIQVGVLRPDGSLTNTGSVAPGTAGRTWGEVVGNDHLRNHIAESYYVPSLLLRAVEVGPVSILGRQVVLECLQGNKAKPGLANIVEDQLRKALVRYLSQHVLGGPK